MDEGVHMNRWLGFLAFCLCVPGLISPVAGVASAEEPALTVELNRMDTNGAACRTYLLFENRAGIGFRELKLDLVMFDPDGVVAKRLAVDGAPLPDGKTSLKVFDVDGLGCEKIGRILLNDVTACAAADGGPADCLGLMTVRSRGTVPLIK